MARLIEELLKRLRVREIDVAVHEPLAPSTPLRDAYRQLEEERRGAVVICEAGRVVGILTERDVLCRLALESVDERTPVSDHMTREPACVEDDRWIAEAIAIMIHGGYRHLPIVDANGTFEGLLECQDIVRFIAGYYSKYVINLPPRLDQTMPRPEGG